MCVGNTYTGLTGVILCKRFVMKFIIHLSVKQNDLEHHALTHAQTHKITPPNKWQYKPQAKLCDQFDGKLTMTTLKINNGKIIFFFSFSVGVGFRNTFNLQQKKIFKTLWLWLFIIKIHEIDDFKMWQKVVITFSCHLMCVSVYVVFLLLFLLFVLTCACTAYTHNDTVI